MDLLKHILLILLIVAISVASKAMYVEQEHIFSSSEEVVCTSSPDNIFNLLDLSSSADSKTILPERVCGHFSTEQEHFAGIHLFDTIHIVSFFLFPETIAIPTPVTKKMLDKIVEPWLYSIFPETLSPPPKTQS
ncbi:hypothetical protein [Kordiimonas laminariae]|uniref:hypothetical protein n=1 Tax=Kordiimonas laminariae TaxID=2917717 RepID=UPI001FF2F007|nr:hypothetical protein [Kordiimonas laminariae]MCK0071118.1 hypothetical protein [Kordiimonas laminariae]